MSDGDKEIEATHLDRVVGRNLLKGDLEYQRIRAAAARSLFGDEQEDELQIGKYKVLYQLGAGGMGEVHACLDEALERLVAVKLVRGQPDARSHARLEREAQALAKLSHPNVVQVHEIGEDHGRLFIVMEFAEGLTLGDWLAAKPRTREEVLATFKAAAQGLMAVHAAGLVHRDFKPSNVIVSADGRVRVVDFGLAFTTKSGAEFDSTTSIRPRSNDRLTTTGTGIGTPHYMPLEQLSGRAIDTRADQFAFCVALYEALWDEHPFPFDTRLEALEQDQPRVPPGNDPLFPIVAVDSHVPLRRGGRTWKRWSVVWTRARLRDPPRLRLYRHLDGGGSGPVSRPRPRPRPRWLRLV